MAISKSLKGVTVSIIINGSTPKEYEAPMDETKHDHPNKTVLRYIEAISGTNYSILIEVSPGYKLKSSLKFVVQIDGWTLPTSPLFLRTGQNSPWNRRIDGNEHVDKNGRKWNKPFKFSALNIVDVHDKDRIKRDASASKHIGEIRVTVTRRQAKAEVQYRSWGMDRNANLEIAEKAVKGQTLSHGTELGEAVRSREQTRFFNSTAQRGSHDPPAVFIFRYRSREALEAEHIIARAPSPDILHGLSDQEIRRMARERLSGNQLGEANIKKEGAADTGTWRKFTNDDETLTIDLTGNEPVEKREPKAPKMTIDLRNTGEFDNVDTVNQRGYLFPGDENEDGNGDDHSFFF
ncbi:hypothetical protein V493_07498 [Pseudogymnoascus sp. VKM F-4281 (FW-2241)]|nr:hypothetical protein V493_07498 [Pseudogymnoascus sp. VKM F-4281 (FW-2241)]